MLQAFDESGLHYLNGFAGKSWALDTVLTIFFQLPSVKLLPVVTCLVWLWFRYGGTSKRRAAVGHALMGAAIALMVSRVIQDFSPHRPRPLLAGIGFVLPYGVMPEGLEEWSSFPSDHAAVRVALSTGIWFGSEPLGWLCLAWSFLTGGFTRVYSGLHYPSDVVGGVLLGALSTLIWARGSKALAWNWLSFEQRAPALFYSFFFVVLFQLATMFDDVRRTVSALEKFLSAVF
jgi:undecaprenyl-diphosphatase